MSRTGWNVLLLGALVMMVALGWTGPAQTRLRNFEYFPDMARSLRYNTFAPNPNFSDGKTLQSPPPGTMPIEDPIVSPRLREAERVPRAGEEAQNPFPTNDAPALARGRVVFETFCQPCHGPGGAGDGIVPTRGFPTPPSLAAGRAVTMNDGALFRTVTRGTAEMPAYAAQIAPSDRWKVVLYVRSLQQRAGGPAIPRSGGASR